MNNKSDQPNGHADHNQRGGRAQFARPNVQTMDQLPPHADEAERGILGCVLLKAECLRAIQERFAGEKVFYDLKHQTILDAMENLHRENRGVDMVSLVQQLRDWNKLDQCGGLEFIGALPDTVPSVENLPTYLAVVWEKYLARQAIATGTRITQMVMNANGVNEPILAQIEQIHEEFTKKTMQGNITPQYLKRPQDLAEGFFAQFKFFGGPSGPPGLELPIPFALNIRRREMTLVSGDDGSGKSTLLNYFALHLAHKGEKIVIASMEETASITLWRLASMLLGSKHLPDSDEGQRKAMAALVWLDQHFVFYDFLGITDWRDLLLHYRYAAEHLGVTCAITDSAMRVGIADDDYGQQGLAAAAFAQWPMQYNAHHFVVIHENKSDKSGNGKVRGSKLWTANASNVLQVKKNDKKGEEIGTLKWRLGNERAQRTPNQGIINDCEQQLAAQMQEWDSAMFLRKQRFPGTPQNGSRYFWFDPESFQFRAHWQDPAANWLQRWKKQKLTTDERG